MDLDNFNKITFAIAAIILVLANISALLQRKSLPLPLLALGLGIFLGPAGLQITWMGHEMAPTLLEQGARLTLAVGLMGVALRLPTSYWRDHLRFIIVILTVGMLLMWVIAAGILYWLLPISLMTALLVGAILTPTDPIVSTPIVTGTIAERTLPDWLRHGISAESGSNDGLGFLYVVLMVDLLVMGVKAETFVHWLWRGLLYEVIAAAIIGAALGWAGAKFLIFAEKHHEIRRCADPGFTLILPIVIMCFTKIIGADGILAAFIGGVVYSATLLPQHHEEQERVQEMMNQFLTITIFFLAGLAWPAEQIMALGWPAVIAVTLALMLRRLGTVFILSKALRPQMNLRQGVFLGWFGAVGIAALYYTMMAQRHTGRDDLWPLVALAITISVVVHGLSSVALAKWQAGEKPWEDPDKGSAEDPQNKPVVSS